MRPTQTVVLRLCALLTLILVTGCGKNSARAPVATPIAPFLVDLPEQEIALTPEALTGRWIFRRSLVTKTGSPKTRVSTEGNPASAMVLSFEAPPQRGAQFALREISPAGDVENSCEIRGKTLRAKTLTGKYKGSTFVWDPVRVSQHWLLATTDHSAYDFDGDGRTEWAVGAYLYERIQTPLLPNSQSRWPAGGELTWIPETVWVNGSFDGPKSRVWNPLYLYLPKGTELQSVSMELALPPSLLTFGGSTLFSDAVASSRSSEKVEELGSGRWAIQVSATVGSLPLPEKLSVGFIGVDIAKEAITEDLDTNPIVFKVENLTLVDKSGRQLAQPRTITIKIKWSSPVMIDGCFFYMH